MAVAGKTPDELAFLGQLGLRVRRARARAGLTRRTLAQRSGVSERYLAQLESGDGNVSILLIRRVASALGADLLELIGQRVDTARRGRVALIGLRGAGKSTLGPRLADALQAPFFELDAEIEREFGVSIENVFAMYGQDEFRDGERRALERLIEENERCVIAVEGSLVVEPQTYQLLRGRCLTVWLRARPEDHVKRVVAQVDARQAQGREHAIVELRAILSQRARLYALADATIDTSANDPDAALALALAAVRENAGDAGDAGDAADAAATDAGTPAEPAQTGAPGEA